MITDKSSRSKITKSPWCKENHTDTFSHRKKNKKPQIQERQVDNNRPKLG